MILYLPGSTKVYLLTLKKNPKWSMGGQNVKKNANHSSCVD